MSDRAPHLVPVGTKMGCSSDLEPLGAKVGRSFLYYTTYHCYVLHYKIDKDVLLTTTIHGTSTKYGTNEK